MVFGANVALIDRALVLAALVFSRLSALVANRALEQVMLGSSHSL